MERNNSPPCGCQDPPEPYSPKPELKARLLGHIRYEIVMLLESYVLGECVLPMTERHVWLDRNLPVEARLVHVRNLVNFFERKNRGKVFDVEERRWREQDSALSSDYGFPRRSVPMAQYRKDALNQDLAHLSYSRQGDVTWPPDEVIRPVLLVAEEFTEHVLRAVEYLRSASGPRTLALPFAT